MYTGEPFNVFYEDYGICDIQSRKIVKYTGTEYFIMYTWFCTVLRLTQFTQTRRYKMNLYKVFLYIMKGF